jgi:hypothetical protein
MLCIHLYKLIWCIQKTLLNSKFLIYHGCIRLCLQISIAASYLLCIMNCSVTSLGHSLMMYRTSDGNNSYLIETVSTLTAINSNSSTRISLLSAVNTSLLVAMNSRGNLQQRTWFVMDRTQIHKFIYIYKQTNTATIYKELKRFNEVLFHINCQNNMMYGIMCSVHVRHHAVEGTEL